MKERIENFVNRLNEEVKTDPFFEGRTDNLPTYEVDKGGRKYIRIVHIDGFGGHRSVWGFVEAATGNIFKAAGWKAPAKHARGNIETAEYGRNYTWTGPNYLR